MSTKNDADTQKYQTPPIPGAAKRARPSSMMLKREETSCFPCGGGNSSEQLVEGEDEPDDITLLLMDQFEGFRLSYFCHMFASLLVVLRTRLLFLCRLMMTIHAGHHS